MAAAVAELGLRYAVVTSVTRDDLPDGGAAHFVRTIRAVRARSPETRVELLVPDFGGDEAALDAVLAERPDVLNHNLETVERLYPLVRRPPRPTAGPWGSWRAPRSGARWSSPGSCSGWARRRRRSAGRSRPPGRRLRPADPRPISPARRRTTRPSPGIGRPGNSPRSAKKPWRSASGTPRAGPLVRSSYDAQGSSPAPPPEGDRMRYLVFTDIHGNLEALLAVLKAAQKKRIDHFSSWATSSATGLRRTKSSSGSRCSSRCRSSAATTTRPSAARFGPDLQPDRRRRHPLDAREDPAPEPDFLSAAQDEPGHRRRPGHHLPRRAVRRGLLHLRRVRRGRSLRLFPTPVCFFGHTHFPYIYAEKTARSKARSSRETQRGPAREGASTTSSTPARSASRGTATRGPLSRSTTPKPGPSSSTASTTISRPPRGRSMRKTCPPPSPSACPSEFNSVLGTFVGRRRCSPFMRATICSPPLKRGLSILRSGNPRSADVRPLIARSSTGSRGGRPGNSSRCPRDFGAAAVRTLIPSLATVAALAARMERGEEPAVDAGGAEDSRPGEKRLGAGMQPELISPARSRPDGPPPRFSPPRRIDIVDPRLAGPGRPPSGTIGRS